MLVYIPPSLSCPLVVAGRIIGVLFRRARRPRAYGEKQVGLIFEIP